MDLDSDDEGFVNEDYYAFLNVSKQATKEEISNAYRNLSRMYHPDKHLDPTKKAKAEILFNKTKRAYEILSDPHRRAIYDSLGIKGLETEGWEIVQRTKTPAEIRAEYEQLAEDRAERRKLRSTNPHGAITININATDLFNPYIDELGIDDYELDGNAGLLPNIEISGMTFNQSVELPLTQKDTCTLGGQLQTRNGTGSGGVNVSWRHIFSHKSWGEVEVLAGNGPALSLKAFRTLNKRFFWNGGAILQFSSEGIRPGVMSTLAMQVDKHTVSYLTYNGGLRSLVSTSLVRDTEYELANKFVHRAGTFGGIIEYGAEKKISKHSWLSAAMAIGVPTGVKLKIRLNRANQVYSFPIHLCEEIVPSAVFYGTVVPLIIYVLVKKGIVEPFHKEQNALKVEKQKHSNRVKLLEKRKEAQAAVDLMAATYARTHHDEQAKNGLVIIKAVYGKILTEVSHNRNTSELEDQVVEVTIPLQCLVKDSKLVLHEQSKSQLPGFFDPAVGEDKYLLIIYNYHAQQHEVTIRDDEILRIPRTSHRTSVT